MRRKRTEEDKQFSLWLTKTLWRRLHRAAGANDTTVTELINRWLEERLDSECIEDVAALRPPTGDGL